MISPVKANPSSARSLESDQEIPATNASVFSRLFAPGLILFAAAVLFFRAPELILKPRFWAEEATLYFKYAYLESALKTLLLIPLGEGGYYSLSANLSALLASRLMSIENAPIITTAFAFIVHLIPVFLIAYGSSFLWNNPIRKFIAVAVYLFAPIHPEESWMNSINSMSYLGIVSLIILAEDTARLSKRMYLAQLILLFCNGLSAVYTVFLAPAFLAKWLLARTRRSFGHLLAVGLSSAIQSAVVVGIALSGGIPHNKLGSSVIPVRSAAGILQHMILETYVGATQALETMKALGLRAFLEDPKHAHGSSLLLWGALLGIPLFLALLSKHKLRWVLLIAFLFEAVLSSLGAMRGVGHTRYAIVAQFSLLLLTLSIPWSVKGSRAGALLKGAVLTLLLFSLVEGTRNRMKYTQFHYGSGAPVWGEQIRIWKEDPTYWIKIWPYPTWAVVLPTKSGTDALRAFAHAIESQLPSDSGGEEKQAIKFESPITEVPIDGRIEVQLREDDCSRVKAVRLIFESEGKRFDQQVSPGSHCTSVTLPVEGPFPPGQPIRGVVQVIARSQSVIQNNIIERISAFSAKRTLFW